MDAEVCVVGVVRTRLVAVRAHDWCAQVVDGVPNPEIGDLGLKQRIERKYWLANCGNRIPWGSALPFTLDEQFWISVLDWQWRNEDEVSC